MMTYYVRQLYQKQHHRRSWRKWHSFDLHSAKNGGGIRVYEEYDDLVYKMFRFHRQFIFELAEEVSQDIQFSLPRKGSLTPVLQMCLALRFYATGSFQSVVGELIGVDQSTACRTITTVTDAACAGLDQDPNAGGSKSPKAKVLRHESDFKCHWMH